jgi:dTDP-4-amino-4,6-dideoxygalactose transaminase
LQRAGIESRPLWAPIHRMPMYSHCAHLGKHVAENIFKQGLALPCSVGLTKTDQDTVIDSVLSRAAELFHEAS